MPTAISILDCRLRTALRGQAVAKTVRSQDGPRLTRRVDLAAQVGDVDVDGAIEPLVVRAEHPGDQFLTSEDPSRCGGERREQPELGRGERHRAAADARLPGPQV